MLDLDSTGGAGSSVRILLDCYMAIDDVLRREEVRMRNAIDSSLDDGNEVFFQVRMRYLSRGCAGDRGGRRAVGGGDEVF